MTRVIKRDGSLVDFDREKIINAIVKAGHKYDESLLSIVDNVVNNLPNNTITVDDIQREVEKQLILAKEVDVARDYITYRYIHDVARNKYKELLEVIDDKLFARDVENQNANVDERSFGGRKGEMANAILKDYALNYCMSDMAKNNHLNNEIYIHDLDSYSLGLHNCFLRSTKFLTDEGIKSFAQFTDGDRVRVLAKDGVWREATVRCYGRQPMQEVLLVRSGKEVSISCTPDHRWILGSGEITTNLRVGDSLCDLVDSTSFTVTNKRSAEMFCLGFIIGDGCDHGDYIQARLCKDKLKYADIFNKANYRISSIKGSNDVVFVKNKLFGKQQFLTTFAWRLLSFEDKVALFNGYLSADGNNSDSSTKIAWTSDERVLQMIKELSALAGYHIYKIKTLRGNTNYKKDRILYEVVFTTQYKHNTAWVVKSIKKKNNKDYEAWCVEEPITKSFTLDGGIVTGNCLSLPVDDLLKNGFKTRQVDIRPCNSVSTAFQLLAVMFQIQSLQMFGGVSATHLDWSLVPYVRKSFNKHYRNGLKYVENREDLLDKYTSNSIEYISIEDDWYKENNKAYKYAMDMITKEIQQAVEGMYHNLNSLQSRSGNQLPFSSINYGTCTLVEGRMIIKALLDGSIKGVGALHKTSVFPK